MHSMRHPAEIGDEILHFDSWTDVAKLVRKQQRFQQQLQTTAPLKTYEQHAAELKTERYALFRFDPYPDEDARIRQRMQDDAARLTTPPPAFVARSLEWPPGVAGAIAEFVFRAAPRPVKEVAIVATLGLLAGICGRQWQIPKSGLNLYIVLVARSAIGKEGMHSGISTLMAACSTFQPAADFVDFTEYASGPALVKACVGNSCFVNVRGEFGRKLKVMATAKSGDAAETLRTQMTALYQKSAHDAVAGGLGYSNTENNVGSVKGVAYSLIGETTPGTFLGALTDDMMEDGFMSRLTVVEYDGPRPDEHPSPLNGPSSELVQWVAGLMGQAMERRAKNSFQLVQRELAAGVMLDLFKCECDDHINATENEFRRQMWNRAHLKALRIAALLAVADSLGNRDPVITQAHADWAINLILRDIEAFTKRLDRGDVGNGDDAREGKLTTIISDYLKTPVPASYKVPDAMRENMIVPMNYLQKKTQHAPAFAQHPFKAKRALDDTIHSMIAAGYLMEVQKDKTIEAYNYQGKAYRVLHLPKAN